MAGDGTDLVPRSVAPSIRSTGSWVHGTGLCQIRARFGDFSCLTANRYQGFPEATFLTYPCATSCDMNLLRVPLGTWIV